MNYGCNDAALGKAALDEFRGNMDQCVKRVRSTGARVVLMTPQSGDIRQTGDAPYYRRKHYADEMLAMEWGSIVDVHHPLEELQAKGQKIDDNYTINSDHIHLTDSAYVAWGYFLYEGLNPPDVESVLEIDAHNGLIRSAENCRAKILKTGGELVFERTDDVLPILPPDPIPASNAYRSRISIIGAYAEPTPFARNSGQNLPPRQIFDMESKSRYSLKIAGLAAGKYTLECNGQVVGSATENQFAAGVNLNTMMLDAGVPAPWKEIAEKLWNGAKLSEIENRTLTFKLKRESE